jgi:C-terminal processing protease CtpA/Prc
MKRAPIGIFTAPLWGAALLAATLACGASLAQDSSSHGEQSSSRSSDQQQTELATRGRDLEAQLAQARRQLEEAARHVAELSAELGADARNRALVVRERFGRGVIGLQLDPASGQDGARVEEVSPGGPAEEAGVRPGDVIVAVNGRPTTGTDSARKVVERVRELGSNAKATLSIKRGAKVEQLQLTTRPAYAFAFGSFGGSGPVVVTPATPMPPIGPVPPPDLPDLADLRYLRVLSDETAGMELASLSPGLGWYFGTDKGVLVLRASENDAFGLKDGDVIVSIDGREPQNGAHATRILRSYAPGERITLKVMRQKRPLSLNVTLPQPRERQRSERRRAGPEPQANGAAGPGSDTL